MCHIDGFYFVTIISRVHCDHQPVKDQNFHKAKTQMLCIIILSNKIKLYKHEISMGDLLKTNTTTQMKCTILHCYLLPAIG